MKDIIYIMPPVIFFQHERLKSIFISGKEIQPSVNRQNVTVYKGTIDCCSICKKQSVYFIIDVVQSARLFLCTECASIMMDKRSQIIRMVDDKFEEVANAQHAERTEHDEDIEEKQQQQLEFKGDIFVLMPERDKKDTYYFMSYDELFGTEMDKFGTSHYEEMIDIFEYKGMTFIMHDEFTII
jgi:hypothetical protein